MVVSVEISGILEERLRRLVELGIYATVAEAVRDAVRDFLSRLDLKSIALDLYLRRGASFQYAVEFAGETYESMIDYFVSRGVVPLIGATDPSDVSILPPGTYVVDGLTLYVAYKSGLVEVLGELRGEGYRFVAPQDLEGLAEVLEAGRILRGLRRVGVLEFVKARPVKPGSALVSQQEAAAVGYAASSGSTLLSDDARTRAWARQRGAKALSSASIIATLLVLDEEKALEYATAYRGIPALLPEDALRRAVAGSPRRGGALGEEEP